MRQLILVVIVLIVCAGITFAQAQNKSAQAEKTTAAPEPVKTEVATPPSANPSPSDVPTNSPTTSTSTLPGQTDTTNNAYMQGELARQLLERQDKLQEKLKEKEKPIWLESYMSLLQQYPWLAVVDRYAQPVGLTFVFIVVFMLVRRFGFKAADKIAAENKSKANMPLKLQIAKIAIWLFALTVASEMVGLHWFGEFAKFLIQMLGVVLSALAWLVVGTCLALLLAFAMSSQGRAFCISLIGGLWYLRYDERRPAPDKIFDLGNGKKGVIVRVDPLMTTYLVNNQHEFYPNHIAMGQHYNWAA